MFDVAVDLSREHTIPARADRIERVLVAVDQELAQIESDVQASFCCRELVEFRDYLEDELASFGRVTVAAR